MGSQNTATGFGALFLNTTGVGNTATGMTALISNTTGASNVATGDSALERNTTGIQNTATGNGALINNTTGSSNIASGDGALSNNTSGNFNVAIGEDAGSNIRTGSNNIDIAGRGTVNEANTIRVGTQGTQTRTFIAGVSRPLTNGSEATELVVDTTTGQAGLFPSSLRFKRDIHDMGNASGGLMRLRPVSFRYKSDPHASLQYGLVAKEVARVYPELVSRGADGKVQSVRYLEFTALLLNELQRQQTKLAAQQREINLLKQQNASINTLSERLAALERQGQTAKAGGLGSLASK
jgi:hypothetical protein